MSTATGYSLWLKPFGEISVSLEQRIQKLSKTHGTPSFPPHITLLGGLTGATDRLKQLTNTLAASVSAFDVVLSKADYTDAYFQCLFVDLEPNEKLKSVRRKAVTLFDHHPVERYRPHLSLLYGDLAPAEKESILNVMGREFHIRFPVHHLQLVNTSGRPADWEEICSVELDLNR